MRHLTIIPNCWHSLRMHHRLAACSATHLAMASVLAMMDSGGGGPPGDSLERPRLL